MNKSNCCAPARQGRTGKRRDVDPKTETHRHATHACRAIPGGDALLGTDRPLIPVDEEGPTRRKRVSGFRMMETAVTNEMFAAFVEDAGFETEAERFGWSFVFHQDVAETITETQAVLGHEWWRRIDGASWRLINGPGSEDAWQPDHPVVHVSWNDAQAYAVWAGGRLPTEIEWEHAARGGLGDVPFPWGEEEPNDSGFFPCNIWQGRFPDENACADGYATTAPAKSFVSNGYGLYNMCGNVWEWTADPFKLRSLSKRAKVHHANQPRSKILKGGSFLCHKSYCFRYRIAARTGTTADTTTSHQGFRLVFDESLLR